MGRGDQLHCIIIPSKVIMKSPSSSAAIRKKGTLREGGNNVMGREVKQRNQKWIKSATILWMAAKGNLFPSRILARLFITICN